MLVQNWIMFGGVLLSWELTPSQLYITLNCSSRSKRFMGFCSNGIKEIHGNFSNVVHAVCNPLAKYDFLASSCEDIISLTNYLNLVFLVLLASASAVILGIVFLIFYSRTFQVDSSKSSGSVGSEVILKSKPRIGLAVVSILLNILALLGVCFSTVLVIYMSQSLHGILSFKSEIPMFNIEPFNNSLGWGFYLLLLANSLLIVHILALVDSARMAKRLWKFSQEITNGSLLKQHSEIVIKNTSKAPEKFFVNSLSPSSMETEGSQQHTGSTFLPGPGMLGGRAQAPVISESQPYAGQYMPLVQSPSPTPVISKIPDQNKQLYPRIGNTPVTTTKSVWGFFPVSLLPRFNPYNFGMGDPYSSRCGVNHCHGHHGCNKRHHHHHHSHNP